MPGPSLWESFFDADAAVVAFFGPSVPGDMTEFGCGYGTFTRAAARHVQGVVQAFDIEPAMVARVRAMAAREALDNIRAVTRDVLVDGTGLADGTQAGAMVFNLLHLADPLPLLHEAHRILRDGGILAVMHWRRDIPTPRGPPLAIRPPPDQCRGWLRKTGFGSVRPVDLRASCPFHFGLAARR